MDYKTLFPKEEKSWANMEYNRNLKKSTAERAAERKLYEMKIKEMQDEHDAEVAKAKNEEVAAKEGLRQWKKEEEKAVKVVAKAREGVRQWAQKQEKATKDVSSAQRKHIEKMRGVTMRMKKRIEEGKLKQEDVPMCRYHCKNEECWAYDGVSGADKTCPHVHKDQAGWDKGKCPAAKGGRRNVTRKRRV